MTHYSFLTLIALAAIAVLALIFVAKLLRIAMDRYVEIELEDQSWVDNLLNQILNDEETETNLIS